jgi:hypothetical protein
MGKNYYTKALEKLAQYAKDEGFKTVKFNHDKTSYVNWTRDSLNTPSVIKIEGCHSDETKVYLMLHELGHHELRKYWEWFKAEMPVLAKADEEFHFNKNKKFRKGLVYDTACMEEEFRAWDEGYKLAGLLEIKLNEDEWFKLKSKCLMSYMKHYSNRN